MVFKARRRPFFKRRKRDALGLCRAVWSSSGLCKVLLMVIFCIVEEATVLIVVRSSGSLGRNLAPIAKSLLIGRFGRLDQSFLFIIKPIESRPVISRGTSRCER